MPTITRRQAHGTPDNIYTSNLEDSHMSDHFEAGHEVEDAPQPLEDDMQDDFEPEQALLPPGLKEISSLASWTVSTAKPGSGVAALRSPDMSLFWQSDGSQPHYLNIHFFKCVPIVLMRIFLDFDSDESYTPTKIAFLAGVGGAMDLVEFAEMEFEQPVGWVDVDFSNVGPIPEETQDGIVDWSLRPVLRAMLVQIKIVENHQNGKDTHLRGVQIFARDETVPVQAQAKRIDPAAAALDFQNLLKISPARRKKGIGRQLKRQANNITLAPWMQEPDLR